MRIPTSLKFNFSKCSTILVSLARRKSSSSIGRKSFYDPSKKSRSVANMEKALGEKYKILAERMTSTKMLSPNPSLRVGKCKSTPPRRIRPVSLFSALASPSPQKVVKRPEAEEDPRIIQDIKPDHHRLLQERMISIKSAPSPQSKPSFRVKETPPRRIQPVRLLFASPSPPKALPGLAEARAKGGLLMRNLSFDTADASPSKTNRVTFSPKPSIQKMFARDSPKKLLRTPTKVPGLSGALTSPMKSILKSPLRSPPHFNMYFTQQPSPLIGKGSPIPMLTSRGKPTMCTHLASGKRISPKQTLPSTSPSTKVISPRMKSTMSQPRASPSRTRIQTRAVRKIFYQACEEPTNGQGISAFMKVPAEQGTDLHEEKFCNITKNMSSQSIDTTAVPSSPAQATTPHRVRRLSLRSRMSPYSDRSRVIGTETFTESLVGDNSLGFSIDASEENASGSRILQEIASCSAATDSSQELDIRSPHRRINKRRKEKRMVIAALDESANLSVEDNFPCSRPKRQRSPDSPSTAGLSVSSQCETPTKKRKTTFDSGLSFNSSSTDYFSSSEIFAASRELPEINSTDCAKFARLGSNSNDFDTSQSGMLRSRLGCQLSGASDSNSNFSYDLPSSPIFTSSGPVLRNKSLERIRSACDVTTSESDSSSRPSSPVFGKRIGELRGVTPTDFDATSPVKSPAPTEMLVSPAGSTRSKTSPGLKKYSPNVSAKGLAELINSPLQYENISTSFRKSGPSSSVFNSPSGAEKYAACASKGEDDRPRSRRSLYRTETKSSLK